MDPRTAPPWPDDRALREALGRLLERQPEPDLARAWRALRWRYAERRRQRRRQRWVAAAAVLALCLLAARADLAERLPAGGGAGALRPAEAHPGVEAVGGPTTAGHAVTAQRFPDLASARRAVPFPLYAPGWLPAGARLLDVTIVRGPDGTRAVLRYAFPHGDVAIGQWPAGAPPPAGLGTRPPAGEVRAVAVGGVPATQVRHPGGYLWLDWSWAGRRFRLEGRVDPDTAVRVAESLQPPASRGPRPADEGAPRRPY